LANDRFFANSGIRLRSIGFAPLPIAPSPIRFSDGEYAVLDEIYRQAKDLTSKQAIGDDRVVIVMFVNCLEKVAIGGAASKIQAYVPRIPCGGSHGRFAEGVFVNSESCNTNRALATAPPEATAKLLADELGHFLGLYHSLEASGVEDHISDTNAQNLMYYLPDMLESTGWSERQLQVMRLHPYCVGQ
jgi:hypothetical protein